MLNDNAENNKNKSKSKKLLIIDNIEVAIEDQKRKDFIDRLRDMLENQHVLMITEQENEEIGYLKDYFVSLCINMDNYKYSNKDYVIRTIEIVKCRLQQSVRGRHPFVVSRNGIYVFPSISSRLELILSKKDEQGKYVRLKSEASKSDSEKSKSGSGDNNCERITLGLGDHSENFLLNSKDAVILSGHPGTLKTHIGLHFLYESFEKYFKLSSNTSTEEEKATTGNGPGKKLVIDGSVLFITMGEDADSLKELANKYHFGEELTKDNNWQKAPNPTSPEPYDKKWVKAGEGKRFIVLALEPGYITDAKLFDWIYRIIEDAEPTIWRVVVDNIHQVPYRFPLLANDYFLFSALVQYFKKKNITSLFIGTHVEESDKKADEEAERIITSMFYMADHLIITRRLNFFGDDRIGLSLQRYRDEKLVGKIKELVLRPYEEETEKNENSEKAVVSTPTVEQDEVANGVEKNKQISKDKNMILTLEPNFQDFIGLEENNIRPVQIKVEVFSDSSIHDKYFRIVESMLRDFYPSESAKLVKYSHADIRGVLDSLVIKTKTPKANTKVIIIDEPWLRYLIDKGKEHEGAFEELDNFYKEARENNGCRDWRKDDYFLEKAFKKCRGKDEHLYAIPFSIDVGMLGYLKNKLTDKLLEKILRDECDGEEFWNSIKNNSFGFSHMSPEEWEKARWDENLNCAMLEMLSSCDIKFKDLMDPSKNEDALIEIFTTALMKFSKKWDHNLFPGGMERDLYKVGIWRLWFSNINTMEMNFPNIADELRLAPLPKANSVSGEWFIAITKGSISPKSGWDLIWTLTNEEHNFIRFKMGLGLPVLNSMYEEKYGRIERKKFGLALSKIKEIYENSQSRSEESRREERGEEIEYYHKIAQPLSQYLRKFLLDMKDYKRDYENNKISLEKMRDDIKENLKEMFKRIRNIYP